MPTPSAKSRTARRQSADALESRVVRTGDELLASLSRVMARLNGAAAGPQKLAKELGVDKVLASRLLKALRSPDGMTAMHRAPGPDLVRRVLRASAKLGVPAEDIAAADAATDAFEELIRAHGGAQGGSGDRTGLETVLSAWVPEARRDFEIKRKQSAFRAISQLKGVQADAFAETAIFWPSADGRHIDIVWLKCVIGLTRLRPGVSVKFTSQRAVDDSTQRRAQTLAGEPIESVDNAVLTEYCGSPAPRLSATLAGQQVHYLVEDARLGEPVRLVTCEVNRGEIPRYVPRSRNRRAWSSSDIAIPAREFQFDTLVHEDLYPGEHPDLRVYDTAVRGTADRNDPARDIDQFDLLDRVQQLGMASSALGSSHVPQYRRMLDDICERLGFDAGKLRAYRVEASYPLYGAQYVMSFGTTEPPTDA